MRKLLIVIVLFAIAFGVGVFGFQSYRNQTAAPQESAYGGPFQLTSMDGTEITEQSMRGKPAALFFGFTHCPVVCPTTLFEMDSWLKQLGAEGENIRAYFITVDPERDTPEFMKTYITNVSDRITGITGDPAKVQEMLKAYHIYAKKVEDEDSEYTMDHTASILLLDSDGRLRSTIAYGESPETALVKLKRLAAS